MPPASQAQAKDWNIGSVDANIQVQTNGDAVIDEPGLVQIDRETPGDNAHSVAVDPTTHRVYFPLENVDGHPVLRVMDARVDYDFADGVSKLVMQGGYGGTTGIDNELAEQAWQGIGAEIMGRRKFYTGPGPIPADWNGFWGPNPPFHTPVIVLTHQPHEPLTMEGGTTFHFRDTTPAKALREAFELAGGLDVRLGGGVSTVREFLDADLVDEFHVVVVPIVLGRGQRIWDGQEGLDSRFDIRVVPGDDGVTHLLSTRRRS